MVLCLLFAASKTCNSHQHFSLHTSILPYRFPHTLSSTSHLPYASAPMCILPSSAILVNGGGYEMDAQLTVKSIMVEEEFTAPSFRVQNSLTAQMIIAGTFQTMDGEDIMGTIREMKSIIQSQGMQLALLSSQLVMVQRNVSRCEQQISIQDDQGNTFLASDYSRLNETINSLSGQVSVLQYATNIQIAQIQNTEISNSATLVQHANMLATITSVNSSNLAGTVAALIVSQSSLNSAVDSLKLKTSVIESEISSLNVSLIGLDGQFDVVQKDLMESVVISSALNASLTILSTKNDVISSHMSSVDSSLASLNTAFMRLSSALQSVNASLGMQSSQLVSMQLIVGNHSQQLSTVLSLSGNSILSSTIRSLSVCCTVSNSTCPCGKVSNVPMNSASGPGSSDLVASSSGQGSSSMYDGVFNFTDTFDDDTSTGTSAAAASHSSSTGNGVVQMGDFTTGLANKGGLSARSLKGPQKLALDSTGGLYACDGGNSVSQI